MDIIVIVGFMVGICVILSLVIGKAQTICICSIMGFIGGLIFAALNECHKQLEIIVKLLGG